MVAKRGNYTQIVPFWLTYGFDRAEPNVLFNHKKQKTNTKEKTIMKKRRSTIVAFLLVAALCLGIGYAALTDVLDIQGTAEVNLSGVETDYDAHVYFSAVSSGEGYTASINGDNKDKASFTVSGLKEKDQTITVTYTIKNEHDLDVVVTPVIKQNSNPTYFGLSSDWNSQPQTITAGGEKTISVSVTLLESPTELQVASFNIELTAVANNTAVTNP